MINNPGRPLSVYDIGGLIGDVFPSATPEQVCSHPKAPARKSTKSRRTVKSAVLTNTPVKPCLEEKEKLIAEKKAATENRKMKLLPSEKQERKLSEDSSIIFQ
ncbi:hypothetical protein PR048_020799 [Dryococelus australis]|uniref:Uncharacterized protein n=1 Tax=Dryococelus australis TaxID=614101 RepID=A0ABQ9GWJ1_9NEOP|nr:hypothetical protein PR048_020799 [Dryococelus australis]